MNTTCTLLSGLLLASLASVLMAAPKDFGEGLANGSPPRLLTNAQNQLSHWTGIGRIRNEANTLCTASLLDTRDEMGLSGPAYVVTSSHCLHRQSGVVQKDVPIEGSISFNYFDDTLETLKTYSLKTLKWASSQSVDLAIIELDASLSDLLKEGITPLRLAEEVPPAGNNILALAAPEWETLHLSACTQQHSQELIEQPFVWRVTMKNQCKGIMLGAFGGPLLDRASNTLFGVLSTTTSGQTQERKCQRDAPCEVNQGIPTWHANTNYGSPITFLNTCFVKGVLTADAEHCDLYPSTSITFQNPEPIQQYFIKKPGAKNKDIVPRWDLSFTINTPFYRYKTTRRARECENPASYSVPYEAAHAHINDAIPPQTGMHMLCILGVDSAQQPATNGMMTNALSLAVELAEPGPARTPDVHIALDKDVIGTYSVTWKLASPFMSRYTYKYGPAAQIDCLRPVDYKVIPPTPSAPPPPPIEEDEAEPINLFHSPQEETPIRSGDNYIHLITTRNNPIKICTYAFDQANQPSTLRVDLLKPR
ncbi:putative lipoprotein [Pseudomonas fluorescens]|uniref:Putative lipoprotein n=1 Tax=Pseudomonas fluorescens TaxID=294 RepID=A0A379I7L2_PSEFL|nr:hypothetical protein [Pseudomonas fluorescens]AIG04305.1 lipoprotein [Pseudomonas fluorescens]SUD27526.1 putative lipoprotein [Pseudomonas fluorescens]